jgi:hypothetical protein
MSHTRFGRCSLLGKIEGKTASLDPLPEALHMILERQNHGQYVAYEAGFVKSIGHIWPIFRLT